MKFLDKWLEAVEKKGSVLCAGLDPADSVMGRGEKGLPKGSIKYGWALDYISAVAPFCAALKPNVQYWKGDREMEDLSLLVDEAQKLGMVVIDDSKLADIGSTNDAGIYYAAQKGFDAVTVAPFAGNLEEIAKQAQARDIGAISMCLMSNPEYETQKNKWVNVIVDEAYRGMEDLREIDGVPHVMQYLQLAHDSQKFGLDGIVIGAPSKNNHITEYEIENVRSYVGGNMLVLLEGVGAQGGEVDVILKEFGKDRVIVNVGRSLMFPNGSRSTPEQQAVAAKHYMDKLNSLRNDLART